MFLQSELFEPWHDYQHAAVRQLAFALASPNIIAKLPPELAIVHSFELHHTDFWQEHYQNYIPRLKALDQHPDDLLVFLNQLKSTRLGLRFEMFIWFWLLDQDYHPYQLIAHSLQKIAGAKTLGELDFVLFNTQTEQIEHWEVALKYYLAEADFTLPHWYGLNRSDTLLRKLSHFTQKQFQFQDALDLHIDKRFAVLKGQLFLPIQQSSNMALRAHWANAARRIGHWGHLIPPSTAAYYRLQRHEWICAQSHLSSARTTWWTNGLYKTPTEDFYMYRQAPYLAQQSFAQTNLKSTQMLLNAYKSRLTQ